MKKIFRIRLSIALVCILSYSSATIVHGSQQDVRFMSNPEGARVKVYDGEHLDRLLFVENTPVSLKLSRGAGYMKAATYKVVVELAGEVRKELTIQGNVDIGWYIVGNAFSGQLLGWLIIDPFTGGMWSLPREVMVDLTEKKIGQGEQEIKVGLTSSVSKEMLSKAVRLE